MNHRRCLYIVMALCFLHMLVFSSTVFAQSNIEELEKSTKDKALENSPRSVQSYLSDKKDEHLLSFNSVVEVVKNEIKNKENILKTPVSVFGLVVAVCLMYSILTNLTSVKIMPQNVAVRASVCVAVAVCISTGVINLLQTTLETITIASNFVLGFVPIFTGIMVSSGSVGSAALYGTTLIGLSAVISEIVVLIVKPLIGIMIGLSVVAGMYDNGFYSLVEAIKKTVMWMLGISTSVFLSLVKLQSIVASKGDSFAFRTSRFIVGSAIPVIGSSVSEALSTVTGGLSVIKSTTGIIGVVSLCAIFIPQIISCVLSGMALYFASVIGEMTGAAEPAKSVRSIKSCIDILIAILALYFMIIVICTAVMMNVGVAV